VLRRKEQAAKTEEWKTRKLGGRGDENAFIP